MNWTSEQTDIFSWFARGRGNLVVVARAGSAKTTSLLHGAAQAREPLKLVTAFNKRIADELVAKAPQGVQARTLHSLGLGYLRRRSAPKVEKWRGRNLIRKAWGQLREEHPSFPEGDSEYNKLIAKLVSLAKSVIPFAAHWREFAQLAMTYNLAPASVVVDKTGIGLNHVAMVAERAMFLAHDTYKDEIDFDDMIFVPLRKGWITPAFDMVCADEAQDVSPGQMELVTRALKPTGRFVAVLDDRQAIYQFRGADASVLRNIRNQFRPTELALTTSFRCAKTIVRVAQKYVPDIKAYDGADEGHVGTVNVRDVVRDATDGDFVLSRTNSDLIDLRLEFLSAGRKATIVGAEDFAEAIKNIVHAIWEDLIDQSVEAFYEDLAKWRRREEAAIDENNESRREWISDICRAIDVLASTARDGDAAGFIFEIATRIEAAFSGDGRGAELSTVHKAKGREADNVYILSGTFPETDPEGDAARCVCGAPKFAHTNNEIPAGARCNRIFTYDAAWAEAERNIRYVAITRAKKKLLFVGGYFGADQRENENDQAESYDLTSAY